MATLAPRGRPPASSCAMLQEAAFELFLEKDYAGTTIREITQRAGVGRATFFNYFSAKSDVFWVDIDEVLALLPSALAAAPDDLPAMPAIRSALVDVAGRLGPNRVPWALTHYSMIGSVHELQASAMSRISDQARVIERFVLERAEPRTGASDARRLLARTASYAAVGAVVAAAQGWASAGTARGELGPRLAAALAPVCDGFQRALDGD